VAYAVLCGGRSGCLPLGSAASTACMLAASLAGSVSAAAAELASSSSGTADPAAAENAFD